MEYHAKLIFQEYPDAKKPHDSKNTLNISFMN